MVNSNRVFPSGEQSSSYEGSRSFQLTARLPNDRPPASARAALVDNEAEIQCNGLPPGNGDGEQQQQQPRLLCSTDSYNFGDEGEGTVTLDAVAEFSTEPESEEAAECGDAAAEDQAAASARRVSHAPTHTLMGPPPSPIPADTEQPSGSLFLGFLESLGVARSGPSDLGPPSRAQSFLDTTSAASTAFLRATSKLHELAMGDDHDVVDKWDNFDDDNPHTSSRGSASGSRRGSASGSRRGSAGSAPGSRRGSVPGSRRGSAGSVPRSRRGSTGSAPGSRKGSVPGSRRGSVSGGSTEGGCSLDPSGGVPSKAAKPTLLAALESEDPGASTESEDGETYEDVDAAGKPPTPGPGGFVYEHATVKVLLWYYLQTLVYSAIVGAISIPLVTIFSSFHWHVAVEVAADQEGIVAPIQPNHPVFQWMMLFWIANPLTFYCPLLLACIKRSIRLPWQMYAVCAFTMAWGAIVCTLFYIFDVPFWLWYLDLFIVLAAYVPCMCTVGWFIDEDAHWKDRLWDVAFTATLETVVAAATLLYCWFLIPLFYTLMASWQKLVWLCTIHPLYFELTTGFIVRKALHRNSALGRTNIMYFLTIVHGMAHQVSITTMLQASVEPTRILAVTVVVYNFSKLFWRSTVIYRHLLFDRVLKGRSFKFSEEERTELARMVSVHVLTEVVLENASIMVTPYLMYRMYDEPLFMMVVPKTFHETGGAYTANTMVTMIFVMLSITVFFDILFWLLNYHVLQFLPLINTWRRIKKARLWYLSFLINAFIFMGVLFVFLIMMMLPRGTYCKSNNYCDCVTSAYESLCRGELFAVHHDYLVDIDPSLYV